MKSGMKKKRIMGCFQGFVYEDESCDFNIDGDDSALFGAFTGLTDTLAKMVKEGTIPKELALQVFDRYKGVLKALLDGVQLENIH